MTKIHLMGINATHNRNFFYHQNGSQDWWLIIQTLTPFEIYQNNSYIYYPENQIVFFPPYSVASYRACGETFKNNWIRFYTIDEFIIHSGIPMGTPIQASSATTFHQLFQLIASENMLNNRYKQDSIQHLFHLLFYKLKETYEQEDVQLQSQDLLNLRFDIMSNPSFPWTVPAMANRLHVSPGYLQAIYKKTFDISCMEDVIAHRISLAQDYLLHGNNTVAQIAELCGYQSTEHFSRQFHKTVGMTPKHYQKVHSVK